MNNHEKKNSHRVLLNAICAAVIAVATYFAVTLVIIPNSNYNAAVKLMEKGKYEEAIAAFKALDEYKDIAEQITACETEITDSKYNAAVELMESGEYEEAITAFKELDGYKDSAERITACEAETADSKYNAAVELMESGNYEEAIAAFEALDGYEDSTDRIQECNYEIAVDLKNSGSYEEAIAAFEELGEYKDSASLLRVCERLNAKIGDYIYFGSYEQDNNATNGKEDIEWLGLDKQDNKIFVISKYALDAKSYNKEWENITWENCTLRSWLNNDFYNAAFNEKDKLAIIQAEVPASKNPEHGTNPGNSTTDNVFLLSIDEANKYFLSNSDRQCAASDYAIAQGAWISSTYTVDGKAACWWRLRSPGRYQRNAADVLSDGSVFPDGSCVHFDSICVRPALWINFEAYAAQ